MSSLLSDSLDSPEPLCGVSMVLCTTVLYRDLWESFFALLRRFFPDFHGDIYLTCPIPSEITLNDASIHCLRANQNSPFFSTRLLSTLKDIKDDFVLLALEDYFLFDNVQSDFVGHAVNVLKNDPSVGVVYLHNSLKDGPVSVRDYDSFFVVKKQRVPYKCNAQFALWRKSFLKKCIRKGENPWEFEMIGTYRMWHYREKALYRKDAFHNAIPYPRGGIVQKGRIKHELCEVFLPLGIDISRFQIYDSSTVWSERRVIKPFLAKIARRIGAVSAFFYPKLSTWLPLAKRVKGVPAYIFAANIVDDLTVIRD